MKIKAMVAMTLAIAANAQALGKIRVCVNSNNHISNYTSLVVLQRAENISSRMFATAGVAVEWGSAGHGTCQGLQQNRTLILDFANNMPASQRPGALAYAQPYEAVHIVVLVDRIEKSSDGPGQMSTLLAHVMTHEITHVLQGIARHSATGVMKAHWNDPDFLKMAYKPLPFAPEDIDLIQRGLRPRAPSTVSPLPDTTAKLH